LIAETESPYQGAYNGECLVVTALAFNGGRAGIEIFGDPFVEHGDAYVDSLRSWFYC
jgi:hypothetical protein